MLNGNRDSDGRRGERNFLHSMISRLRRLRWNNLRDRTERFSL